MCKDITKSKYSFLKKILKCMWVVFYDAMVIIGIMVAMFTCWAYCR